MSTSFSAVVVIGMRLLGSRRWKSVREEAEPHAHENAPGANYCSQCGLKLRTKTIKIPWDKGKENGWYESLFGYELVYPQSEGEPKHVIVVAETVGRVDSEDGIALLSRVDFAHIRAAMESKLMPHGLWSEGEFGAWLVNTTAW